MAPRVCEHCRPYQTDCQHVCPTCDRDVPFFYDEALVGTYKRSIERSSYGSKCERCGNWTHDKCLAYGSGYNGEYCIGCGQLDYESGFDAKDYEQAEA